MRRYYLVGLGVLLVMIVGGLWLRRSQAVAAPVPAALSIAKAFDTNAAAGYRRADVPRTWNFPDDHGAHHDYQTEWWYFTGNLRSADGREWGYEFTVFRSGFQAQPITRTSNFALEDVYLGHFALTDVAANRFYASSLTQRGGKLGLAGVSIDPAWKVFVGSWQLEGPRDFMPKGDQPGAPVRITAAQAEASIELDLRALLDPVLQGENGRVQKGPETGIASYYYSIPRWATSGTITVGGTQIAVTGESWMDHEWMTTAIAPGNVGWDWFALRLADGRSLMWYQFLKADGSADSQYSVGSLVSADGSDRQQITPADVQLEVLDYWTSPHSRARYPAKWRIRLPKYGLDLTVQALIPDQELRVGLVYWEGAVAITGTANGQPIEGLGYVELACYTEVKS